MEQQGLDVVALGELLIDFTDNGPSTQGNPTFECNPGGAPCNVLAMLSKLGHSCSFIGKVGRDMFGTQLRRAAEEAGISMAGLVEDPEIHTTLAFVQTLPGGDRDFSFYRNPGADMALTPEEIPAELLSRARIFHFGSLSLTDEPVRSATRRAVAMAREAGALISFDPNLRPPSVAEPGGGQGADCLGPGAVRCAENFGQRAAVYDRGNRFPPGGSLPEGAVSQPSAALRNRRGRGELLRLWGPVGACAGVLPGRRH